MNFGEHVQIEEWNFMSFQNIVEFNGVYKHVLTQLNILLLYNAYHESLARNKPP